MFTRLQSPARSITRLMLMLVLAVAAGCGRYSRVNMRNPGRAEVQRHRAVAEHDPYPDPDAGPEVVGGRPREFDTPPPEPAWLQKRASNLFSPYGSQAPSSAQPFTAAPIYQQPVYHPPISGPVTLPNYAPATVQPNYSPPPSYSPNQPTQPVYPAQ